MTYLEIRNAVVSFSGFRAIDGLNFGIPKGELRCLIGPNGAGKTTTLDLICGKTKATSGQILLEGTELGRLEEHEIARRGIGRKFQVPSVFKELLVWDNLRVAVAREVRAIPNLFRFGRPETMERLHEILRLVGLDDVADVPAGYLSHGQTQWLEIAMVLALAPELVLLDEPTAGMTSQETRKTAEIFTALRGRHTLIVVEHDMDFVKEIADLITVMHQGRVLAEGTAHEIETDPQVKEVYLGSGGLVH